MFYMPQLNSGNKQILKSRIALVLLICFVIVFLFSESFIIAHTVHEHDCDPIQERGHNKDIDNGCNVCTHIQNVRNILKLIGITAGGASCVLFGLFAALAIYKYIFLQTGFQTLINLKIRMNN